VNLFFQRNVQDSRRGRRGRILVVVTRGLLGNFSNFTRSLFLLQIHGSLEPSYFAPIISFVTIAEKRTNLRDSLGRTLRRRRRRASSSSLRPYANEISHAIFDTVDFAPTIHLEIRGGFFRDEIFVRDGGGKHAFRVSRTGFFFSR